MASGWPGGLGSRETCGCRDSVSVASLTFDYVAPGSLHFGAGRFREAPRIAAHMGRRPFVVTTRRAMQDAGHLGQLRRGLEALGLAVEEHPLESSGPTTSEVDLAAGAAQAHGSDLVIALGGGTVIDAAKAVAAVATGVHTCADLLYRRERLSHALPILAIASTPGTGSELDRSAIVTDPEARWRDGIRSDSLFPRAALVDPALALSLSRSVTALTGFDILSHAVESYVSPKANPLADAWAVDAFRRVLHALPRALEEPAVLAWRVELALAGSMMGMNLATVGTCVPHRLDKAVCALHPEIPHGQCVAFFYPAWIRRSHLGNAAKYAAIARLMDPALEAAPVNEAAAQFSELLEQFLRDIGLRASPHSFGLRRETIHEICRRIPGDCRINPVPFSAQDVTCLLEEVIQ